MEIQTIFETLVLVVDKVSCQKYHIVENQLWPVTVKAISPLTPDDVASRTGKPKPSGANVPQLTCTYSSCDQPPKHGYLQRTAHIIDS